jgi:protein SCO1
MKSRSAVIYLRMLNQFLMMICVIGFLGSGQIFAAPKGSPWGKDYFPNVELVNQDSQKLHFYDDLLKDKVVAINFIYTQCGDSCPAETASLKRVQKLLGDRVGKDIFFYSISVDPKHDTPNVLKEYANRFNVGHNWQFLTGRKDDVILIRKKFGLYREEEQGNSNQHNINFIIGNEATGQWMKKTPFDEPKSLAWLLGYTLPTKKIKPLGEHVSYNKAQQIERPTKAEEIFRFRCASCHTLTKEDGVGPGLQGITKTRDRAWLTRWIKSPDQLLAEHDPIAENLYNRFNKIMMPNLRLDDDQVEALINYMEGH